MLLLQQWSRLVLNCSPNLYGNDNGRTGFCAFKIRMQFMHTDRGMDTSAPKSDKHPLKSVITFRHWCICPLVSKKYKSLFNADESVPWSMCTNCTWILSTQKFGSIKMYHDLRGSCTISSFIMIWEVHSSNQTFHHTLQLIFLHRLWIIWFDFLHVGVNNNFLVLSKTCGHFPIQTIKRIRFSNTSRPRNFTTTQCQPIW